MIERLIPPHPEVFCHNDLLNANFIADENGRIWIVDWEYAGMGDRFFDLANFSVNHDFTEADDAALLASYGVEDERSLVQMRFMSDFREAMWAIVQTVISELDFDFEGYATEHFERMEATAASERFRKALL
jgi:thiamine kinase-like enzyme